MTYNKLVELTAGQSLYLRVYPWYNGTATGKTICLYGLLIKGMVSALSATPNVRSSELNAYCFPTQTTGITTLKYSLKQHSDVKISLQSIDGRTLKLIEKKNQTADNYQQVIDFSSVSSGLYLVTITSGTGSQTIRIVRK
ncbi:MAG: T9SS type A sorting domain-containing protein [Paludibacter sp.]